MHRIFIVVCKLYDNHQQMVELGKVICLCIVNDMTQRVSELHFLLLLKQNNQKGVFSLRRKALFRLITVKLITL